MANTATVTGKAGPGLTVTAAVFTNVTTWTVDNVNAILTINTNGQIVTVDIGGKTTFTVTVSGGTYAVAVS